MTLIGYFISKSVYDRQGCHALTSALARLSCSSSLSNERVRVSLYNLCLDLGVSRFKSTRVDLSLPSRVESILLTSTTGFVDLSRFCFKSTWNDLVIYFRYFLQYCVSNNIKMANEHLAICYFIGKLLNLIILLKLLMLVASLWRHANACVVRDIITVKHRCTVVSTV